MLSRADIYTQSVCESTLPLTHTHTHPFNGPFSGTTRASRHKKGIIIESRVPELIPVLGSQPAGDVSHKPGGRLSLLSARPATLKMAATNFAVW